jgi:hypothetical protein
MAISAASLKAKVFRPGWNSGWIDGHAESASRIAVSSYALNSTVNSLIIPVRPNSAQL